MWDNQPYVDYTRDELHPRTDIRQRVMSSQDLYSAYILGMDMGDTSRGVASTGEAPTDSIVAYRSEQCRRGCTQFGVNNWCDGEKCP